MIVIAHTSPLSYLIQIGQIDVLPKLYKRILIPPAVLAELNNPIAPKGVRAWISWPAERLVMQAPSRRPDSALIEAKLGRTNGKPSFLPKS